MTALLDRMRTTFSASERFKLAVTAELLEGYLRQLPTEYVVWTCSLFTHLLGRPREDAAVQRLAVDVFVPQPLRLDVRRALQDGEVFIYEEQLLGLSRLAMEFGTYEQPGRLSTEQQRAWFWALALYGDLRMSEWGETGDEYADIAANVMRSLAFAHNDVWGNLLGRAEMLWIDLPSRDEFKVLPYAIPIAQEFERATDGVSLVSYFAAVMGLLTHSRTLEPGGAQLAQNWAFDAADWFRTSARRERAVAATNWLSADRRGYLDLFAQMPRAPRYAGLAMLPFRYKPVYRFAGGRAAIVSERFLVEGVVHIVYWTIWEYLKTTYGEPRAKQFEQFFGTLFERYVVELLDSGTNGDGAKRVFGEREAVPAEGAPDATLFLPDTTLCFEVTKQQLRYIPTLLAADLGKLSEDLERTADKAAQLRAAAERFRSATIVFPTKDSPADRERRIDRVVVVLEPIPRWPALNDLLYSALVNLGVSYDDFVISVSEVEEALLRTNPSRLRDLLVAWLYSGDRWEFSFHDALARTGNIVRSDYRAQVITTANERLRDLIRGELALPPETVEAAVGSRQADIVDEHAQPGDPRAQRYRSRR